MRQIINSSILFLFVQLGLFAQSRGLGAVEMSIPFSVAGFQVCESYPVAKQKQVLKDFQVFEIDTEFGLSHKFIFTQDDKLDIFSFRAEELGEFAIETNRFALNMGKVQLRVGDHKDKLKGVPGLKLKQAINHMVRPPEPWPNRWRFVHPDIMEDVVNISVYIENDIITGFHGMCML